MLFTVKLYRKFLQSKLCYNQNMSTQKQDLYDIFIKGMESVQTSHLLKTSVKVIDNKLHVQDKQYVLQKPCYVIGFGKAVMGMSIELERILDTNLKSGIVMIPTGILQNFRTQPHQLPAPNTKLRYIEGAHNNMPDLNAMQGAEEIKNLCDALKEDDLLIVLMSGGGSALLPLPTAGITLDEKIWLIERLANAGADIFELNTVRKKISQLKGGGLAMSAYPAKVISLILSDVIGDSIDFIASGPTAMNSDEPAAAFNIIQKYNLAAKIPHSIRDVLNDKSRKCIAMKHNILSNVDNYIIGSNKMACVAAENYAKTLGYETIILSTKIHGNVNEISNMYAELVSVIVNANSVESFKLFVKNFEKYLTTDNIEDLTDLNIEAKRIKKDLNLDLKKGICIISAGEPTVVVKGAGKGGRNQHLALAFSKDIAKYNLRREVSFLSCGTDGIDGPTDAAGAVSTCQLFEDACNHNVNVESYLDNNDSYNFFQKYRNGEFLIKTGHTGTNVMDLHVILISCN